LGKVKKNKSGKVKSSLGREKRKFGLSLALWLFGSFSFMDSCVELRCGGVYVFLNVPK
jgi:hypothetical protein